MVLKFSGVIIWSLYGPYKENIIEDHIRQLNNT